MKHYVAELKDLESRGILRTPVVLDSPNGPVVDIDGRKLLNFCSNDYLGLAGNPIITQAMNEATSRWGTSSTSSRLVSGNLSVYRSVERSIASFMDFDSALFFSSGYACNLGVIQALASRDDLIVSDELNHASLIDGCRLSRAQIAVYKHCDVDHASEIIRFKRNMHKNVWLVTESVFSMGGDIPDLKSLLHIASEYDVNVLVDEAHAFGVLGPKGRGVCALLGLRPTVVTITFGKSAGVGGAAVVGAEDLIRWIENKSRSFVYSTAPIPALPAGVMASLELIQAADNLRAKLQQHVAALRENFDIAHSNHPIFPLKIGDPKKTMAISSALFERGVFARGIRPPTVPTGGSLIRLVPVASHSTQQIDQVIGVVRDTFQEFGVKI